MVCGVTGPVFRRTLVRHAGWGGYGTDVGCLPYVCRLAWSNYGSHAHRGTMQGMCERRACVVVFEGGQVYYRMHVYAQHDARSRIASERCRPTRRCPAYRVEMSAAMPMDLGE